MKPPVFKNMLDLDHSGLGQVMANGPKHFDLRDIFMNILSMLYSSNLISPNTLGAIKYTFSHIILAIFLISHCACFDVRSLKK